MTVLADKITEALDEARNLGDDPWANRVRSSLEEAQLYSTQVPGSEKSPDDLAQERVQQTDQERIADLEAQLAQREPQQESTTPPQQQ